MGVWRVCKSFIANVLVYSPFLRVRIFDYMFVTQITGRLASTVSLSSVAAMDH